MSFISWYLSKRGSRTQNSKELGPGRIHCPCFLTNVTSDARHGAQEPLGRSLGQPRAGVASGKAVLLGLTGGRSGGAQAGGSPRGGRVPLRQEEQLPRDCPRASGSWTQGSGAPQAQMAPKGMLGLQAEIQPEELSHSTKEVFFKRKKEPHQILTNTHRGRGCDSIHRRETAQRGEVHCCGHTARF